MSDKNLIEILKKTGGLFPKFIEDGIENNEKVENPPFWDDPLQILRNGKVTVEEIKSHTIQFTEDDISNLSRAAREGNTISDEVKKRMLEDKKNARK